MSGNPLPVMSKLIEDNGMIGDVETAALVCRGGAIDWLCWPRLDPPARFAARLAEGQHGCWRIAPTSAVLQQSRRYRQEHSSALGRASKNRRYASSAGHETKRRRPRGRYLRNLLRRHYRSRRIIAVFSPSVSRT